MKKSLLAAAIAAALSLQAFATDTPMIISTGAKDKSYYPMGMNIKQLMPSRDKVEVIPSKGSLENIENVLSGKANVALTFADAYAYSMKKNPDVKKLEIIGSLGKGCLYTTVSKTGKIKSDQDLQKESVRIAIGKEGAGSNATWKYMSILEPGFAKAMTFEKGDALAMSKLLSNSDDKYDAVLQMQTPSTDNSLVLDVLAANSQLTFLPIKDWDLNNKLPNGKAVYTFENIELTKGLFNQTLDTICTDTLVIADPNLLSEEQMEDLANIIMKQANNILKVK